MRNYEITFLYDCIVDCVPMYKDEKLIVRKVSMDSKIIELINNGYAVITKIIEPKGDK